MIDHLYDTRFTYNNYFNMYVISRKEMNYMVEHLWCIHPFQISYKVFRHHEIERQELEEKKIVQMLLFLRYASAPIYHLFYV